MVQRELLGNRFGIEVTVVGDSLDHGEVAEARALNRIIIAMPEDLDMKRAKGMPNCELHFEGDWTRGS